MKTKILTSLLLFVVLQSQAQIEGYWKGEIDLGAQKLETAFDIKAFENGYSATFDVPAQGVYDISVDETSFQDGHLELKMNALNATYSGVLKESTVEGEFTQHGMTFPLNLFKAEKKEQKKTRPQDPLPPFNYHAPQTLAPFYLVGESTAWGIRAEYAFELRDDDKPENAIHQWYALATVEADKDFKIRNDHGNTWLGWNEIEEANKIDYQGVYPFVQEGKSDGNFAFKEAGTYQIFLKQYENGFQIYLARYEVPNP